MVAGLIGPVGNSATTRAQNNCRTFTETKQQVCGRFLEYWDTNGGLAQQGLPLSPEMDVVSSVNGKTYKTQWFERAVFELHSENQKPYDVLLSLLGVMELQSRYGKAGPSNQKTSTDNPLKFSQTGKTIGGKFRTYWEGHGGLPQQGYPISDEFQEVNKTNGKTYTVQYFERAIFEAHPENQPPNDVLLTLLGVFSYNAFTKGVSLDYPGGSATLTGAGSTFVNPLMSKWSQEYNKLYSGVKVNYQSIGSGGGRQQFLAKTVDFGASDAPLTDDQFNQAGGPSKALHIPLAMGGVVMIYNLPGVSQQLKMDGNLIADIYLLKITKWNDTAIAALNPGVSLPNQPIAVVHRAEGSGTTDIFTDYLTKVSSAWAAGPKRGTSIQWPGGIGAQGNEGVTNQVKLTPGAIGYVELSYAKSNGLPNAVMKNQAGNFVDATSDNVSEAADSLINTSIPADLRYSITNAPGTNSYPIAGTVWGLVYVDSTDAAKAKVLTYFLWWATHEGQKFSESLFYSPLPRSIRERVESQLVKIKCGSGPCATP